MKDLQKAKFFRLCRLFFDISLHFPFCFKTFGLPTISINCTVFRSVIINLMIVPNCLVKIQPSMPLRGSTIPRKQCHYQHLLMSSEVKLQNEVGFLGQMRNWFRHGTEFWIYLCSRTNLCFHMKSGILISQSWL